MTDIFITSFFRVDMTLKTIGYIKERTIPGTYKIHIFDNGSDKDTQSVLINLLDNALA